WWNSSRSLMKQRKALVSFFLRRHWNCFAVKGGSSFDRASEAFHVINWPEGEVKERELFCQLMEGLICDNQGFPKITSYARGAERRSRVMGYPLICRGQFGVR